MRARLKVCCIASVDEARLAIEHGATALGLVSEMPSGPGPIPDELIAEIARAVPVGTDTFLLTCLSDPAGVVDQVRRAGTTTVQLVDDVEEDVYAALRRELPHVRIVQVVHVQDRDSIDQVRRAQDHTDMILLDSGRPRAAVRELGGTGRTHDWTISVRIVESCSKPVFLAGGINPANVRDAIDQVRPYGIDLCTGVRTNGALDPGKLAALTFQMR
ncbi:MAG: N-(5'-phosphoribosyl)anthranilate isomerase [Phycisphaerae bacterium]